MRIRPLIETRGKYWLAACLLSLAAAALFSCTKEKIIIYKQVTDQVALAFPPNTGLVFGSFPELIWEQAGDATGYKVQVATDASFFQLIINSEVTDTSYVYSGSAGNNLYFWRVRAKNSDGVWGDWSEALIWSFRVNDASDYIALLTVVQTPGIAQDVFVQQGIAYVADGLADLTMVDVADPAHAALIANIDTRDDDFAKCIWKKPDDDFVYVADMDFKLQIIDASIPVEPFPYYYQVGLAQNLEDISGLVHTPDSVYIFSAHSGFGHRELNFFEFVYDPLPRPGDSFVVNPFSFPSDAFGVFQDTLTTTVQYRNLDVAAGVDSTYYETQRGNFVYCADGTSGLWWFNISYTHTFGQVDTFLVHDPRLLGWQDTPSISLSVHVANGFAYVADDRGGLQIFDLPDTIPAFDSDSLFAADPVLIADINTSGRTKDVQAVGNRCYLADGSGGLKVVDITDPYNPVFLAAYTTPYAYGVWADENYIYITDRDNGLMIFESR